MGRWKIKLPSVIQKSSIRGSHGIIVAVTWGVDVGKSWVGIAVNVWGTGEGKITVLVEVASSVDDVVQETRKKLQKNAVSTSFIIRWIWSPSQINTELHQSARWLTPELNPPALPHYCLIGISWVGVAVNVGGTWKGKIAVLVEVAGSVDTVVQETRKKLQKNAVSTSFIKRWFWSPSQINTELD